MIRQRKRANAWREYVPLSIRQSVIATAAWRYVPWVNYRRGTWLARRLP